MVSLISNSSLMGFFCIFYPKAAVLKLLVTTVPFSYFLYLCECPWFKTEVTDIIHISRMLTDLSFMYLCFQMVIFALFNHRICNILLWFKWGKNYYSVIVVFENKDLIHPEYIKCKIYKLIETSFLLMYIIIVQYILAIPLFLLYSWKNLHWICLQGLPENALWTS